MSRTGIQGNGLFMYVAGKETTTETPGGGEAGSTPSTPGGRCTGALFHVPVEPEECSYHPNNTNKSQVTSKNIT